MTNSVNTNNFLTKFHFVELLSSDTQSTLGVSIHAFTVLAEHISMADNHALTAAFTATITHTATFKLMIRVTHRLTAVLRVTFLARADISVL